MHHDIAHPDDLTAILRLDGELDVSQTLAVRELVLTEIGPGRRVVVDLTTVPFIDSSGIGMLVGAHRAAGQADAWFAICGADATVTKVLDLTRTNRVLRVFTDAASALAAPTMEVPAS